MSERRVVEFPIVSVEGVVDDVLVTIRIPRVQAERMGLIDSLAGLSIPNTPAELCEQRPHHPEVP